MLAPVSSATFKMHPSRDMWAAWITLALLEAPPPELIEWCRALPEVRRVELRGFSEGSYRFTLSLNAVPSTNELHPRVLGMVKQLEARLGFKLNADDQGIHTPKGVGGSRVEILRPSRYLSIRDTRLPGVGRRIFKNKSGKND